jgi:lysyl-tRNA synthetase class 2
MVFSENFSWLRPQRLAAPFSVELLREGDLLAVQLKPSTDPAVWSVQAGLLLAPCLAIGLERNRSQFTVERSRNWSDMLALVREYFAQEHFIEVVTPSLVPSPGTEPFLQPFRTEWAMGFQKKDLYLPTSPEFHLKKLLSRGWSRVFEFKTCFRNGELSEHHQAEFTMLEWYRAYSNLEMIARDVERLCVFLSEKLLGQSSVRLEKMSMSDLFQKHFSFQLTAATSREELARLAEKHKVAISASDSWDDVFHKLFLSRIEPTLGQNGPLLVHGYPPSQAALSRLKSDGFADRFEIYWRGLEIANAFHELNDPEISEARFQKDADMKSQLGFRAVPQDQELNQALRAGLPPSGGIALGVDRLFMALFGIDKIVETRAFPMRQ